MPKVIIEKSGAVMHVRINRPEEKNACDGETYLALAQARDELENDVDLRVGILSGEGDDFCVGTDVSWVQSTEAEGYKDPLYPRMMHGEKPVIAAIHGKCVGAGLEIALACDIRVCTQDAEFGSGNTPFEWIPGGYGTQRLPRVLPLGTALELLYTGDLISAGDAYRLGLVNHVLPDRIGMMEKAEHIAEKITHRTPHFVAQLKTSVMDGLDMALPAAVRLAIDTYGNLVKTTPSAKNSSIFEKTRSPE